MRLSVCPAHRGELLPAVAVGIGLTVTDKVVFEHPVTVSVNVNVALPDETPVTTPASVTVATALSLLVQVPPVVGESITELPTQTAAGAETTGSG